MLQKIIQYVVIITIIKIMHLVSCSKI